MSTAPVSAQTINWSGASSTAWNSGGNWVGGTIPSASSTAAFVGTATNTTADLGGGSYSVGGINFAAGSAAYTVQNGSLVTASITDASSSNETIAASALLSGATSFTNSGSGTLSFTSSIDNSGSLVTVNSTGATSFGGMIIGSGGLTKTGAGTLTLGVSNIFTGVTTISAGVIAISNATSLQNSTVTVNVNGGLTNGSVAPTLGGLAGSGNLNLSQPVTVGGNNATTLYSGSLTESGNLVKNGTGTLELSGSNSFGFGLTVNAGVLQIDTAASLNNTAVALSNSTLTFNNGSAGSYTGAISGTGNVIKNGAGALTLTSSQYFTGGATINAGSVIVGGGATQVFNSDTVTINANNGFDVTTNGVSTTVGSIAGGGALNLGSTTLTLNGSGATTYTGALSGTSNSKLYISGDALTLGGSTANSFAGTAYINSGSITLTNGSALANAMVYNAPTNGFSTGALTTATIGGLSGSGNDAIGAVVTITGVANNTFSGVLSGAGGLTMNSTSTTAEQSLGGANTFTGPTTITQGILGVANSNALQNSTVTLNVNNGLDNVYGTGTIVLGALGGSGAITYGSYTTLNVGQNNASTTYSGNINSPHVTLTKNGTGTMTLTGASMYGGGTNIIAGAIAATGGSLGTGTVTVTSGATLNVGETPNPGATSQAVSTLSAVSLTGPTATATTPILTFNLGASAVSDTLALTAASGSADLTYSGSGKFLIGFASATGAAIPNGALYHLLTFSNPGSSDVASSGVFATYGTATAAAANNEFSASGVGNSGALNGTFLWTYSGGQISGLDLSTMPEPSAVALALSGIGAVGFRCRRRKGGISRRRNAAMRRIRRSFRGYI